ncbi:MAG: 3'-5' exonuclease [Candidatus Methylomirabilia bacterium]
MEAGRPHPWCLLGGAVLLCAALFTGADLLLLSGTDDPTARARAHLAFGASACLTILILAGFMAALRRLVFRPLELLDRETRIVGVNPGHAIELPRQHLLADLPQAIGELGAGLARSKRALETATAAGANDTESRQARLETILASLQEGLLVCDDRARIVFYNPAARGVFHDHPALGIGRSLHLLVAAAPIEDSLQILRQRRVRHQEPRGADSGVSFVCTTLQGGILSCRVRLLPVLPWSFLLTCEDISGEADAHGRRESLLRATVKEMRAPLTGLGLSAESLELIPDLDAASRAGLEHTIVHETRRLVGQFEVLAREVEEMASLRFLARDVLAEDLVACVAQRLEEQGLRLTMIGEPLWVRADVHALLFLLEFLALGIRRSCGVGAIELESLLGDKRVYFTFCWKGAVIPQAEIERWKSGTAAAFDGHTVGEVLERLGSEIWSRPHETPGFAVLSFPVPSVPGQCALQPPAPPPRPVFVYTPGPDEIADIGGRELLPLDRAFFVVFDAETTGLAPGGGDEIVSLAGVKIVNRGIVVSESFNQLVDPGRGIPPSSTRIHGITDDQVRGRPRIEEVLRAFHSFVGDAVLVGHNAAFDMRFIRLKQQSAGVRFRGPLLDTLTLSRFLHDHTPAHSLDAVARRLGVEVRDRHTALGDSLITAEVFLKLLYLLQERGVSTLGGALEVSER